MKNGRIRHLYEEMNNMPEPSEEEKRRMEEEWNRLPEEEKRKNDHSKYYDAHDLCRRHKKLCGSIATAC